MDNLLRRFTYNITIRGIPYEYGLSEIRVDNRHEGAWVGERFQKSHYGNIVDRKVLGQWQYREGDAQMLAPKLLERITKTHPGALGKRIIAFNVIMRAFIAHLLADSEELIHKNATQLWPFEDPKKLYNYIFLVNDTYRSMYNELYVTPGETYWTWRKQ